MSQDALASPLYGLMDTVPSGRSRIWASGFGSWAEQKTAENLSGYKWDERGLALGYEYAFNNCLQLGFGAAYSKGELTVSNLQYANNPDIGRRANARLPMYSRANRRTRFFAIVDRPDGSRKMKIVMYRKSKKPPAVRKA